jgi:predicted secreted acid phosphatase
LTKQRRKKKAVVLDLDDTVFDFLGYLITLHNALHSTAVTKEDVKTWDLDDDAGTEDIYGRIHEDATLGKTFHDFESHGLYAVLPLVFGARQAIRIYDEFGYSIIFLTARDKKFEKDTILALLDKDIPYEKLLFNKDKAAEIKKLEKSYDIVLFADDRAASVKSVNNNCKVKTPVLINRPHNNNAKISQRIVRVRDLLETVKFLEENK